MKTLLLNVSIESKNYSGPGKILLTEKHVFFFKPSILSQRRPSLFVQVFGFWADLADSVVAGLERSELIPDHLRDHDLRFLSRKQFNALLETSSVAKFPLSAAT